MAELWADRRHRDYAQARDRRQYARDHFTGEVHDLALKGVQGAPDLSQRRHTNLEQDTDKSSGIRIYFEGGNTIKGKYLVKRAQGEADEAYKERVKISRYANHYATMVEAFVGGVFQVEDKAERQWGDPLGSPEDEGSVMDSLWEDIDGAGKNWMQAILGMASDLIVDGVYYYRVDRETPDDPIRVYRIDPDSIVNWVEKNGVLVELLTHEIAYEQETLLDEPEEVEYYTHYTLDGWTLFRVVEPDGKKDRELVVVRGGGWEFPLYTAPDKKVRRLPFGRVVLPVNRPLGYQMAEDANFLYNLFSDGRWILRVLNYPRLAGDVEDPEWMNSMEALAAGWNALQGNWKYISPDPENAEVAHRIYQKEVGDFYVSNHQKFNEAAIERSATEVLYGEAAGRTAFLTLFAGAIDEGENGILFLASQILAPTKPDTWRSSKIERSLDFKPIDIEALANSRATRFATYAASLPAELALRFSGHTEDDVNEYVEHSQTGDPNDPNRGAGNPFGQPPGDGATEEAGDLELGAGPVGGGLQDIAT